MMAFRRLALALAFIQLLSPLGMSRARMIDFEALLEQPWLENTSIIYPFREQCESIVHEEFRLNDASKALVASVTDKHAWNQVRVKPRHQTTSSRQCPAPPAAVAGQDSFKALHIQDKLLVQVMYGLILLLSLLYRTQLECHGRKTEFGRSRRRRRRRHKRRQSQANEEPLSSEPVRDPSPCQQEVFVFENDSFSAKHDVQMCQGLQRLRLDHSQSYETNNDKAQEDTETQTTITSSGCGSSDMTSESSQSGEDEDSMSVVETPVDTMESFFTLDKIHANNHDSANEKIMPDIKTAADSHDTLLSVCKVEPSAVDTPVSLSLAVSQPALASPDDSSSTTYTVEALYAALSPLDEPEREEEEFVSVPTRRHRRQLPDKSEAKQRQPVSAVSGKMSGAKANKGRCDNKSKSQSTKKTTKTELIQRRSATNAGPTLTTVSVSVSLSKKQGRLGKGGNGNGIDSPSTKAASSVPTSKQQSGRGKRNRKKSIANNDNKCIESQRALPSTSSAVATSSAVLVSDAIEIVSTSASETSRKQPLTKKTLSGIPVSSLDGTIAKVLTRRHYKKSPQQQCRRLATPNTPQSFILTDDNSLVDDPRIVEEVTTTVVSEPAPTLPESPVEPSIVLAEYEKLCCAELEVSDAGKESLLTEGASTTPVVSQFEAAVASQESLAVSNHIATKPRSRKPFMEGVTWGDYDLMDTPDDGYYSGADDDNDDEYDEDWDGPLEDELIVDTKPRSRKPFMEGVTWGDYDAMDTPDDGYYSGDELVEEEEYYEDFEEWE